MRSAKLIAACMIAVLSILVYTILLRFFTQSTPWQHTHAAAIRRSERGDVATHACDRIIGKSCAWLRCISMRGLDGAALHGCASGCAQSPHHARGLWGNRYNIQRGGLASRMALSARAAAGPCGLGKPPLEGARSTFVVQLFHRTFRFGPMQITEYATLVDDLIKPGVASIHVRYDMQWR